MRTIPLLGRLAGEDRTLTNDGSDVWFIANAEGARVRPLNAYEARFVRSTLAACAGREAVGCAQVRRDLVAAREATARLMTAWREALGANVGDDLEAITRGIALENRAWDLGAVARRRRRDGLDDLVRVQTSQGNWDYDPYMHGMANGMLLAQSLMAGNDEPRFLEAPAVWGRDAGTLRGRYRLARGNRASILGAVLEALFP